MLFWKKKTPPLVQSSASAWREQWRAIVPPEHCTEHILQRVQWAESSDDAQMVPSRTEFATVGVPGTPAELANWLRGGFMSADL